MLLPKFICALREYKTTFLAVKYQGSRLVTKREVSVVNCWVSQTGFAVTVPARIPSVDGMRWSVYGVAVSVFLLQPLRAVGKRKVWRRAIMSRV